MTVLNFSKAKQFNGLQESMPDLIVFIKPLGSIFHRVFTLPKETKEKIAELNSGILGSIILRLREFLEAFLR